MRVARPSMPSSPPRPCPSSSTPPTASPGRQPNAVASPHPGQRPMIVLDTTVLCYTVGESHPLREPCRQLLLAQADGRVDAATTIEVIQEFVHVRARRRTAA